MARQKRNDIAVKIDATLARRAKVVAAERNIPLAQYLTEALTPIVAKDHSTYVREQARQLDKPRPSPDR